MAYVYLLCDSGQDRMYKIGVTKTDVERRIKKLQTGNGNEIFLINKYETEYPFYIEKMLHKKHYPDRKIGEWFELPDESVINFVEECKFFENIIDEMEGNPFFKIKK